MNKMKSIFRKIGFSLRHDFFTIENIVLFGAIILCLVWTYQSVLAMSRNWELSERITTEKRRLELLQLEIDAAELENEYYKSAEYQELAARKYLDKKLPDENMLVMPENSEAAKNKYSVAKEETSEPEYSNFEKWMKFLMPEF